MKIILAPDSFKEALTAQEVCQAMAAGIHRACPEAKIQALPMADGGEGTVQALLAARGGSLERSWVTGPQARQKVQAAWGRLADGETAVIEMAAASGLELLGRAERNPWHTTTYGTGELIQVALDAGCRKIILGIGGSATNDAGVGMAMALGGRFLDDQGQSIGWGGGALADLAQIDLSQLDPRLKHTEILVASDVTNPLVGDQGAAAIFGPQKGADPAMVAALDRHLNQLTVCAMRDLSLDWDMAHYPGGGAAGGLGAGLKAFLGAQIQSGIDLVIAESQLAYHCQDADYLLTGEGSLDGQSVFGKTPQGVAQIGRAAGVPVIALAGRIGPGAQALYDEGVQALFAIGREPSSLETALTETGRNLERTCENIMRLLTMR
ncbi:glycerate kinase [Aerococcus sanguinicola]|uniref:glycerate kinase n=1 Tax=unclassified Aerococcus TaxID=2618060 RepID=UPI0008A31705|nr:MULTISPECIES: glycerate kinase [unclassified Aerococcus]KAB0647317.1 glycerate kinase [Aerococcus sanguinicola]MDK6233220.1 glycerate kinase [Aerococcus sp. UMB10185]MDK6856057.1 glycerate kinase [Aerococcus sp. UMB7533]OFN00265.1 glycerate kinase [Aerococcus sp. HMSC062A02]OHO44992.1 glycerate kinase [Aerococcus sp. HMSC035B07]